MLPYLFADTEEHNCRLTRGEKVATFVCPSGSCVGDTSKGTAKSLLCGFLDLHESVYTEA